MNNIIKFLIEIIKVLFKGNKKYFLWVSFLVVLFIIGASGYYDQFTNGLAETNMVDSFSWGFYIGNFTFMVGIAAAAVVLVIPAYIYDWKPIKDIVIFGEIVAISAVVMALMFVLVDIGKPLVMWHMIPGIGNLNFPSSLLAWDSIVLNVYFGLNLTIVFYFLWCKFYKKSYNKKLMLFLVLFSIPAAISIHTVTAFLYNGLVARPYWNHAILAPKFIISAFCSGPAVLLIAFQVLRKTTKFNILDEALFKIAEIMAYAVSISLFFFSVEVFVEVYSNTHHVSTLKYLFLGYGGNFELVPYAWASMIMIVISLIIFIVPKFRRNIVLLNVGAVMIYFGMYVEKGLSLIGPGFATDVLGQFYRYFPSLVEIKITFGIIGIGGIIFTLLTKIANAIINEGLTFESNKK